MATLFSHRAPPQHHVPGDVELARLDSTSPSLVSSPPPYDGIHSPTPFLPTVHLQIQTTGKPLLSLPLPPRPEPIPVYSLHPDESSSSAAAHVPKFTSFRPERFSGSCYLVSSETTLSASTSTEASIPVLSTTTYRFGLNRPPVVRLFSPHAPPLPEPTLTRLLYSKDQRDDGHTHTHRPRSSSRDEVAAGGGNERAAVEPWDTFTVSSLGLLTRAVEFRTRLGTFQWRYASRRERHHFHREREDGGTEENINSLLVLERVLRIARARSSSTPGRADGNNGDEELRTTVAHFIRGPASRTPGSRASSAGNGGRLVVDLAWLWQEEEEDDRREPVGGEKGVEKEMAVAMVVTTCLVMLKREVDRRRAQQMAIMASAAAAH